METMTATFKVVQLKDRTFAFRRHTGPYLGDVELVQNLFRDVRKFLVPLGFFTNETEAISIHHDSPDFVPVAKQRISVGFTVPKATKGKDDIRILVIPAGRYAIGSFELNRNEYAEAWSAMFEFLKANGLQPSNGLMYESYKNDLDQDWQGNHRVDICIAVK
ncbi:MAG: GyrI-like domain-containing protein [Saprospiraceae bacterium]|nr:GyrI-like domain-containing protein [Saprospiraceae bacterium]